MSEAKILLWLLGWLGYPAFIFGMLMCLKASEAMLSPALPILPRIATSQPAALHHTAVYHAKGKEPVWQADWNGHGWENAQ